MIDAENRFVVATGSEREWVKWVKVCKEVQILVINKLQGGDVMTVAL